MANPNFHPTSKFEFSGLTLQYAATFLATISIFISGSHMVWTSPSLPKLYDKNSTIHTTIADGSLMGSLSLIANLPSSPLAALAADRFGRKTVIHVTPILYLVGWLMIAYARTVLPILIAKVIVGIGDGSIHTVLPMYIGEIADDVNRGSLGIFIVVMLDLGILYTYAIGPWLSIRHMALISSIFPLISLCTFIFMPESPYYYLMRKKELIAKKTLKKLRGNRNIEKEFYEMSRSVSTNTNDSSRWKDLCLKTINLKALMMLIGIATIQQFSGISAILIYSQLIFEDAGGLVSGFFGPILLGSVQLLADIFAMMIVDIVPRRFLLFISCVGCCFPLVIQSVYFLLNDMNQFHQQMKSFGWLPITNLVVYIIAYSIGLGPIPIVLSSELFATGIKAKGMAVLDNYVDLIGFAIALAYQFLADNHGAQVPFFVFAATTAIGVFFTKFCLPETKGQSLEEIQNIMQGASYGN